MDSRTKGALALVAAISSGALTGCASVAPLRVDRAAHVVCEPGTRNAGSPAVPSA